MKWLKDSSKKVLRKIEDHIATVIAGVVIAIILALGAFFWEWLKTKHSLEIPGWVLVLTTVLIALLPTLLYRQFTKLRVLYKKEEDIKNILQMWSRQKFTGYWHIEENVYFDTIDKDKHLPKGSAAKFLPDIVRKNPHCNILNMGDSTMLVKYHREKPRRQSGWLDDLP
jgi:hypothetical protein